MMRGNSHGTIWPDLPALYLLAFVAGVALLDWLLPSAEINQELERTHPYNIRWCVGLSYSSENGESEDTRVYFLIPDSFKRMSLFAGSRATGRRTVVEIAVFQTIMVVGVYGYGVYMVTKEIRRRLRNESEAEALPELDRSHNSSLGG